MSTANGNIADLEKKPMALLAFIRKRYARWSGQLSRLHLRWRYQGIVVAFDVAFYNKCDISESAVCRVAYQS